MTRGLLALAKGEGTGHPLLVAYLLAQRINQAAGGAVISPWEVNDLPDEWIDAAKGLTSELAELRAGTQQVEDRLARWREEHRKKNG